MECESMRSIASSVVAAVSTSPVHPACVRNVRNICVLRGESSAMRKEPMSGRQEFHDDLGDLLWGLRGGVDTDVEPRVFRHAEMHGDQLFAPFRTQRRQHGPDV